MRNNIEGGQFEEQEINDELKVPVPNRPKAEVGHEHFEFKKVVGVGVLLLAISTGCGARPKESKYPAGPVYNPARAEATLKEALKEDVEARRSESEAPQEDSPKTEEARAPVDEKQTLSIFKQFRFLAKSRGDGTFEVQLGDNFGNSEWHLVGPEALQELKDVQNDYVKKVDSITKTVGNLGLEANRVKRDIFEPRMMGVVRRCEKLSFEQLSPAAQKVEERSQKIKEKTKNQNASVKDGKKAIIKKVVAPEKTEKQKIAEEIDELVQKGIKKHPGKRQGRIY